MIKKIEENLREFVYGGMDGAVTTFAVVTGAAGAGFSDKVILVLGLANVVADGFSMAVGAYLSDKADQQLAMKKGTKDSDIESPLGASIATFVSFLMIGLVPLSIYIVNYVFKLDLGESALTYSIILTLLAFAIVGYLRAVVTKISTTRSVIESLGLGVAAAVISYTLGTVLEKLIT